MKPLDLLQQELLERASRQDLRVTVVQSLTVGREFGAVHALCTCRHHQHLQIVYTTHICLWGMFGKWEYCEA